MRAAARGVLRVARLRLRPSWPERSRRRRPCAAQVLYYIRAASTSCVDKAQGSIRDIAPEEAPACRPIRVPLWAVYYAMHSVKNV